MARGRGQDNTETAVRTSGEVFRHGDYVHDLPQLEKWAAEWSPVPVKRVLISGDIHSDWGYAHNLIRQAQKDDCNTILVVGDFGYWPHQAKDNRALGKLEQALKRANIRLYWIDGNHENFTALNFPRPEVGEGFKIISPSICYIPRGLAWDWNGVRFLGFGGAASTDKAWRLNAESKRKRGQRKNWFWWPQELVNDDDEQRAISAGKADILISHDAPDHVYMPKFMEGFNRDDMMTNANRERVGRVLKSSGARQVYHGHYHTRYETDVEVNRERVHVDGLARNGQKHSFTVLDLSDFNKKKYQGEHDG